MIDRKDLPDDYVDMMKTESHHSHEIIMDERGTIKWMPDPFTVKLIKATNLNLVLQGFEENGITRNSEVCRELFRKMGYSLSSYYGFFYCKSNIEDADLYTAPTN